MTSDSEFMGLSSGELRPKLTSIGPQMRPQKNAQGVAIWDVGEKKKPALWPTKLVFALLGLCVLVVALMAYLSHDPRTIMQTRFSDNLLLVIGSLLTLLKRPNDRDRENG